LENEAKGCIFANLNGNSEMEISGIITQILAEQTGTSARGEWTKQDFIIETKEQFPKKVCISNWGGKADLKTAGIGAEVTCHVNVESREFNGKWYTDIKVWKMDMGAQPQGQQNKAAEGIPLPPPPAFDADEADDLPF
jgi:hypothetical protein